MKMPMDKWIQNVKTESTFPPPGTFSECMSGLYIATIMARQDVSPYGLRSAINMVVYFKNRGGKKLSKKHIDNLNEAVRILQEWREKHGDTYRPRV